FLWFSQNDLNIESAEFQMTSHVFGAVSSPFCASFALRQTVSVFKKRYDHEIKPSVLKNFCVDDCFLSLPSVTGAKRFVQGITKQPSKGCFHPHKCASSVLDVLQVIPLSGRTEGIVEMSPKTTNT
ncbi:hypothetical protein CLF_113282, partial [Clonorchis sinensis]